MTGRRLVTAFLLFVIALIAVAPPASSAAAPVPVILKLLPGVNISAVTSLLGGKLVDSIPGENTYLVNLPSLPSLPLIGSLLRALGVQWLEPNRELSLPRVGTIGLVDSAPQGADWYKNQPALRLVRVASAQQYSTGRGVLVADINSVVDYAHPALSGHLTGGYDFVLDRPAGNVDLHQSTAGFLDESDQTAGFLNQSTAGFLDGTDLGLDQSTAGFLDTVTGGLLQQSTAGFLDGRNPAYSHGTLCAGLIAVVAPDAAIMPLRAFDDEGGADLFTLAKAVHYARKNGAQVINMSFGTLTDSAVLREAIEAARNQNIVLVASAGNNNVSSPQYPASYEGVIGVAATDLMDVKASFSNYGRMVFVTAPGTNIISAYPGGEYYTVSGTSFSAPITAGTAALTRSLRVSGVPRSIAAGAVNIDLKNWRYYGQLGYGRIDALKTVRAQ
jgi:subtilisin family serine protease